MSDPVNEDKLREPYDHIGLTSAQLLQDVTVDQELVRVGYHVIERQKEENFTQTWRNHWNAACWSLAVSTALWMEGFDTAVVNSFFGMPQFIQRFGKMSNGKMAIPASDQTALNNLATVGQLCGLLLCGYCQERFGSKRSFFWGMVFMTLTIFVAFFAQNLPMLMAAEFLMGCPWGIFQTLATSYAAEICPINMRGYLTAYASLGWGGGRFVSTGVLRGTLNLAGDWAWRVPYACQWMWPLPLAIMILFAPESPWWLVRKGRVEEAKLVIRRLARSNYYAEGEIDGYAEYMRHTDALDRAEAKTGSFWDMWKGTNLRRTELQLGTWIVQQWNGNAVAGLTVLFLEEAGMSTAQAFNINVVLNAFSVVGVAMSWVLLRYYGRRTILILGLIFTIGCNIPIGVMGTVKATKGTSSTIAAFMILINLVYHFSTGPVTYTISPELPASNLRSLSVVLGRWVYTVNGIVVNTLNPYMVSSTAWNWQAKSGYFWAGTGMLCLIWVWFRLPETAGFSFAELNILFANKVSARKFKSTIVTDEHAQSAEQQIVGLEDSKGEVKAQVDYVEDVQQLSL